MSITLIVAAGGSGTRFQKSLKQKESGKKLSKLFVPLFGKPLLVHTLKQFQGIPAINEIVVTLPTEKQKEVLSWAKQFNLKKLSVTRGGKTRAESVKNGLRASKKNNTWVMVHDGARPFVSSKAIGELIAKTKLKSTEGAILASKVVPTIKQVRKNSKTIEKTIDRTLLYEAETPQLAKKSLLAKGFRQLKSLKHITDESGLLESLGARVDIVTHQGWNPKITTSEDLDRALKFLSDQTVQTKVGFGKDLHRLEKGRKLYLGGVRIPSDFGALGHSDGDALLHAVSDAILGCLALGDIGDYFSDKNPKYKGLKSSVILKKVVGLAEHDGWVVDHLDTIISLEKPRLGHYKHKIKDHLVKLLKINPNNVSVKAKTHEGLDALGRGEAVSCDAVVTMKKVTCG